MFIVSQVSLRFDGSSLINTLQAYLKLMFYSESSVFEIVFSIWGFGYLFSAQPYIHLGHILGPIMGLVSVIVWALINLLSMAEASG